MNLEGTETKEGIVDAPNGEPTAQPVEPPKAEPEKKEYESKVKALLERPTVKIEDMSEVAQEMIEDLKVLTDNFEDWDDKRAREFDLVSAKWIKDEFAGRKVSPSTKQRMEELDAKYKKMSELEAKHEKEEKEKEELKAEKKRKEEEVEAEKQIKVEEVEAEKQRKVEEVEVEKQRKSEDIRVMDFIY